MLVNVNRKQITVLENPLRLVAESSDLQLAPGMWPEFIAVTDDNGSGFLFHKVKPLASSDPEEFAGYTYTTNDGIELTVFND